MTTPPIPPQQPPVPPQQPPQGPYGQAPQPMNPADEKLWATLIHIGGIFFEFIPALIGYLVLKDRGPFINGHAKTALNFQLTLLIAEIVGWITAVFIIGFIILAAVYIVRIIFSIIAAVKANQGQFYMYPLSIPFIK
ncbi:DUF4870 domain-containing protein [Microbacterium horticulturae]|uniref:DUF4870 domain-containing protein n=1 Tax=Microbacterium horticulturae TaxID=3028316 RepID=A0ABY8BZD2_9MICO|nr:DUF4870 domain-containing protein [Microbacterium sp. KACC 23027]WEG08355.1 DUF4870 domain-containing protein [Microbacterium sp. KACC 23027]